jgi:hypothetical protein
LEIGCSWQFRCYATWLTLAKQPAVNFSVSPLPTLHAIPAEMIFAQDSQPDFGFL